MQGLVDKFTGDKTDEFVECLDDKLKSKKLDKLNSKLNAKNPTKKLTKKAYDENPGERDRILKRITAARAEIEGNADKLPVTAGKFCSEVPD